MMEDRRIVNDDDDEELARCRSQPADWRARRWLFASFAAHALLLALFFFAPPESGALTLDLAAADARYVRVSLAAMQVERSAVPRDAAPEDAGVDAEPEGASPPIADLAMPRHRGAARPRTALDDEQRARASLDVLREVLGSEHGIAPSPYADVDSAMRAGYADLLIDPGPGLGMQGAGRGGGGAPNDTFGLLGFGMPGSGASCTDGGVLPSGGIILASCNGVGRGSSVTGASGRGVVRPTARESRAPRLCGGAPAGCDAHVQGSLTREQVRRVVSRQRAQIAYCYEQALVSRPDLRGRVTVRWMIAPDGRVTASSLDAARTDVRSEPVEQCALLAVRRWTFPESGGVTAVSYPFVLETTD